EGTEHQFNRRAINVIDKRLADCESGSMSCQPRYLAKNTSPHFDLTMAMISSSRRASWTGTYAPASSALSDLLPGRRSTRYSRPTTNLALTYLVFGNILLFMWMDLPPTL